MTTKAERREAQRLKAKTGMKVTGGSVKLLAGLKNGRSIGYAAKRKSRR